MLTQLTSLKSGITRKVNALDVAIRPALSAYGKAFVFPQETNDVTAYIEQHRALIPGHIKAIEDNTTALRQSLQTIKDQTTDPDYDRVVNDITDHWNTRQSDKMLDIAGKMVATLRARFDELTTQEQAVHDFLLTAQLELINNFPDSFPDTVVETKHTPNALGLYTRGHTPIISVPKHYYGNNIAIPAFKGDIAEWHGFWALFSAMVDQKPFTPIETLTVLLDRCEGDAATHLSGIDRSDDGYTEAVLLLKHLYDDVRVVQKALRLELTRIQCRDSSFRSMSLAISKLKAAVKPLMRQNYPFNAQNVQQIEEGMNTLFAKKQIEWRMITPLSPWKGGFYEIFVKSVKQCVNKTFKNVKTFNDDEFLTILAETEAMVNTRPLCYVSSDPNEQIPLRPVDFLQPHNRLSIMGAEDTDDNDSEYTVPCVTHTAWNAQKHLEKIKRGLTSIWNLWSKEYLTGLTESHKDGTQRYYTTIRPQIGDVVLLKDDNSKRGFWKMARITDLHKRSDGEITTATVNHNGRLIKRSIAMLVPIEVQNEMDQGASRTVPTGEHLENANNDQGTAQLTDRDADSQDDNDSTNRRRPSLPRTAKQKSPYGSHKRSVQFNLLTTIMIFCMFLINTVHAQVSMRCVTGGVEIQKSNSLVPVQICADDYCMVIHDHEESFAVTFPADIVLHDYYSA